MRLNEYDIKVKFNNQEQDMKTFASSIEGAIDNMILLEDVDSIYSAICLDTGENFYFGDDLIELKSLKEMRKNLPEDMELSFEVQDDARDFRLQ